MKKLGWENELTEYIRSVAEKPFRPGRLDCGLFFAGAVEAITGEDYAKELRGKYKTIEEGIALLQSEGFEDHVDYAASKFEAWPSPLFAQRGDGAVIVEPDGSKALGIVQGSMIYAMTLQGLALVSLDRASKAFKL